MKPNNHPELRRSEVVERLPQACASELAAVEFLEHQRWGDSPCCLHCGSVNVYKMLGRSGERNKRFLWRCRDCGKQYTVRVGTVYEESRIELRHWCYTLWRACTSKKGVSAREIQRQTQLSYKSALFLLHRIRHAMDENKGLLTGTVEVDEAFLSGKTTMAKRAEKKQTVMALVERGGNAKTRVVADVTAKTLQDTLVSLVDPKANLMTDGRTTYRALGQMFASHQSVKHSAGQYVNGEVHVNTVESYVSLVKRSLTGIYHAVSKEHLHRYLAEREFTYNHRRQCDGERVAALIHAAEGKRLVYKRNHENPTGTEAQGHDGAKARTPNN